MLLAALLITQASAEWVEISQQHYRKPLRIYQHTTKTIDLEDTTKPWFSNYSVTDYNWDRAVINRGDEYRRAGDDRNPILNDYGPVRFNPGSTIATDGEGALKGTVNRVPNVGNVKRVHLNNSPVKSPSLQWNTERGKIPHIINADDTERDVLGDTTDKQAYDSKKSITNAIFPHMTTSIPFLKKDKDEMMFTDAPFVNKETKRTKFNNYTEINTNKQASVNDYFKNNETLRSREKINQNRNSEVTEQDVNANEDADNEKHTKIMKPTYEHEPKEHATQHQENIHLFSANPNTDDTKDDHKNDHLKTQDEATYPYRKQGNYESKEGINIKANKSASKLDTIENIMKFMMVITDTISKNSRRSFNGKMHYLQELKNNILANIEDRIDATWPDDDGTTSGSARRGSRSAHAQAEPRGHVEFPSSESSLMTISFLTFAVFLIKLVLQVIQTYKNKSMMVAPLVVAAAGRAAFAHRMQLNTNKSN